MKDSHGNILPKTINPATRWTDDCQGKKDFDGWLISISTRYWPGPDKGGTLVITGDGDIKTLPYSPKPSAHSSINILFGEADEEGYNADYFMLAEKNFEGETEDDVKVQVEVWTKDKANQIKDALVELFTK